MVDARPVEPLATPTRAHGSGVLDLVMGTFVLEESPTRNRREQSQSSDNFSPDAAIFGGGLVVVFLDALGACGSGVNMVPDLAMCTDPDVVAALEGGSSLSLVASDETRRSWADARARHHPEGRAERGHAEGTLIALAACKALTLVCQREGCGLLVHWMAARRSARAHGRDVFATGDGCGGPRCSAHSRPARVRASQAAMAARLGSWPARVLIQWPEGLCARTVELLPAEAARAAAADALAAATRCARPRRRRCRRQASPSGVGND